MTARTLLGIPLAALALCIVAFNDYVFVLQAVLRRRAPSWIPLLGALFGAAAFVVISGRAALRWCWVPFVLDWGSLPGIAHALVVHRRARRHPTGG